jgi:arsenate reductase (glutaredoxin)
MSLAFYGYAKCGTSRNAQKWLLQNGTPLNFVDITRNPPTVDQLRTMVETSGLNIRKFFNTSGELYRELKLKDKLSEMSHEEMLRLLAENGMLIKRPLVTDGAKTTVGFKEEDFRQTWA